MKTFKILGLKIRRLDKSLWKLIKDKREHANKTLNEKGEIITTKKGLKIIKL